MYVLNALHGFNETRKRKCLLPYPTVYTVNTLSNISSYDYCSPRDGIAPVIGNWESSDETRMILIAYYLDEPVAQPPFPWNSYGVADSCNCTHVNLGIILNDPLESWGEGVYLASSPIFLAY